MKFEDFRLSYGFPVQFQLSQSQPWLNCNLVGCLPSKSVILTLPKKEALNQRFRNGQQIRVRLMVSNGIFLFAASIEHVQNVPFPALYLSYPSSVGFKQIRGATRVEASLPIIISNLVSLEKLVVEGILADISISGARVEMKNPIGNPGDQVQLAGNVSIGSLKRKMSIEGTIRSRIERSTREEVEFVPAVYGIEFTETDENRLLVLHAFVFSEMAKSLQPGTT